MFIYQADILCDPCGQEIRYVTDLPEGADPNNEYTWDSSEYPKYLGDGDDEADRPQHCGRCGVNLGLPKITRTPWGEVSHSPDGFVTIVATESETYKWANRVSARWPCSTLAGAAIECAFVSNGDLVDFEGPEDIDGHELNAFVSDTLRAAALSHHPAVKL